MVSAQEQQVRHVPILSVSSVANAAARQSTNYKPTGSGPRAGLTPPPPTQPQLVGLSILPASSLYPLKPRTPSATSLPILDTSSSLMGFALRLGPHAVAPSSGIMTLLISHRICDAETTGSDFRSFDTLRLLGRRCPLREPCFRG